MQTAEACTSVRRVCLWNGAFHAPAFRRFWKIRCRTIFKLYSCSLSSLLRVFSFSRGFSRRKKLNLIKIYEENNSVNGSLLILVVSTDGKTTEKEPIKTSIFPFDSKTNRHHTFFFGLFVLLQHPPGYDSERAQRSK